MITAPNAANAHHDRDGAKRKGASDGSVDDWTEFAFASVNTGFLRRIPVDFNGSLVHSSIAVDRGRPQGNNGSSRKCIFSQESMKPRGPLPSPPACMNIAP